MSNINGENMCEMLQSMFTQLVKQLQSQYGSIPEWSNEALPSLSEVQPVITPGSDQLYDTRTDCVGKRRVVCHHCKRPGHVKNNCFDLIGYPSWWQQRQVNKFNFGKSYDQSRIVAEALGEVEAKTMTATSNETAGSQDIEGEDYLSASWIIDSGASNHMTGSAKNFSSYIPRSGKDRVRIADGSSAPIMGSGTIDCTSPLPLSLVLHVPNFPVSLLSVSSITKQLNCRVVFEPEFCVFQDLKSEKILGTGTEHDGLYYLNNVPTPLALSSKYVSPTDELLLLHSRLGHPSFQSLSRMFPSLFASCYKDKLLCEVCELAKHTRTNYPSSNERSKVPFEIVHSDVWGPSAVTSLSGERWYVTFIDGFSRCTWLYLLKHKFEVLSAFKDFYSLVCNQYNATVKIFRSDNGTEYVNREFHEFLSSRGIIHQTTCVNTAEQNGIETEGEDNTGTNGENEVCDIPPQQQVIEPDIPAPTSPRLPLHQVAIHDEAGRDGDHISIGEDQSLPREHTQDSIEEEGDDDEGIEKLKQHLTSEFEVKDLGQMRYFLGIEVSRSSRGGQECKVKIKIRKGGDRRSRTCSSILFRSSLGHLRTYNHCDNVWTFDLRNVTFRNEEISEKVGRLKIVAIDSSLLKPKVPQQ